MSHDGRIAEAIADLRTQDRPNIAATAKKYQLDRSTLSRRFRGKTGSNQEANSSVRQHLTDAQEETLVRYINKLSDRGFPPTPQIVKNLAEEVAGVKLTSRWVSRFCKKYESELISVYLRTIDHKRKLADNSHHFNHFFKQLQTKIEKYHITAPNMYNFDEKGFLIGLSRSTKRIIARDALESKRTARASQDGSREFITVLAAICADGSHLTPALIYQGASHDLRDTWLDDFDPARDRAFFASSEKGWSSDVLGFRWLQDIFDPLTKDKAGRARRLLIVDGHSSHINMSFIDYADRNRIILAVLPPHSTHRLQPLDVGLFSPLATYYTQEIDRLLVDSLGLVRLTKRDFWVLFKEAWIKAFSERNVRSAWDSTGIHPLSASKVLSRFESKGSTIQPEFGALSNPSPNVRGLRWAFKQLQKEGQVTEGAKILLDIGEKLATKAVLLQHENQGLKRAVIHEKRKRKRGKAMNLYDPSENEGQALFFSPGKVMRVRQRAADEAQAELQMKQAKSDKKLQAAIARDEKAREAREKQAARNIARQAAREQLAREKAERQAIRQAQRAQKATEIAKRKEDAARLKEQRILKKRSAQKDQESKKRSLEVNESHRPKKRVRTHMSLDRPTRKFDASTGSLETKSVQLLDASSSIVASMNPASRMRNARGRQISLPLRSGRTSRLPARFL